MNNIRTRFPPSPTGFLHVGGLRTALFNFLWAKKNNGQFILRIEDTDRERFVEGATESIIKILNDFGLTPDEGPNNGDFGPYIQSERLDIYKQHANQLIEQNKAYAEETEKGTAIRFRMTKDGATSFDDMVYGHLEFQNSLIADPIILKSDGYPTYNFANVIDDHLMQISHVLRGEEFLPSTAMHIKIYESFGWAPPIFAHLPLILDFQRKKLSKRTGDVAVEEYVSKGYIKEAILNFIALLGWNPKSTKEIFGMNELIQDFEIEKINKSGAIFDLTKLDYLNREWRRKLNLTAEEDPLYKRIISLKPDWDAKVLHSVWPQIIERISGPSVLEDALPEFEFYFKSPEYKTEFLLWKKLTKEQAAENLKIMSSFLQDLLDSEKTLTKEELQSKTLQFIQKRGLPAGEALWPLRVALSGQKNSPSPFEIIETFILTGSREEIFTRIDSAISKLR